MLRLASGGVDKMYVLDSGNVGIGTSSPATKLHVVGGTASGTMYDTAVFAGGQNSTSGSGARIYLSGCENDPTNRGTIIAGQMTDNGNSHALIFSTSGNSQAPSERMRLDSSGNVLVGKSVTTQSTAGTVLYDTGQIYATASGTHPLVITRKTNDGALTLFYKDAGEVGRIAANGGSIIVGSGDTGLYFDAASDRLIPVNPASASGRDNAVNLGGSSERFKDVYAVNYHGNGSNLTGVGGSTTAGAVGTYALMWKTSAASATSGTTVAGSGLRFASTFANSSSVGAHSTAPSGTWRLMGSIGYYSTGSASSTPAFSGNYYSYQQSLFVRIS